MKTKLLKKIRKRFSWVWSKKYKRYDIIDRKKEECTFIDKSYVKKYFGNKPPCGYKEAKYRLLREFLYNPFIYKPLTKIIFRKVRSNINKKLKK